MASRDCIIVIFLVAASYLVSCQDIPERQPDDVDSGKYDNMDHSSATLCARTCHLDEPPRICYYKFHLEPYTVLSGACGLCPLIRNDCFRPQCVTADGYEKAILTVNRRMSAPSIQVCKGDIIIADVINQMPGSSTSIHWHGNRQRLTPWMDGVPMVTQCPIMEGQTYRYRFVADEPGTYFWHSHDGLQKVEGIVGGMVVRQPDLENPMRGFYDLDLPSHVVVVQDWIHTTASEGMPGLRTQIIQVPDSYLINGRGVIVRTLYDLYGSGMTPLSEFRVRRGLRYRFRIVSGTCLACTFRITVQDHKLLVIAIDDNPIEPVLVDNVVLSAGERYDVVIEARKEVASYWMLVRGLGACAVAQQAAVLQYEGSPTTIPTLPHWDALLGFNAGYSVNPRNSACNNVSITSGVCVSQLRSRLPTPPPLLKSQPDLRLVMAFGFHSFTNQELFGSNTYHKYFIPVVGSQLTAIINNISNAVPPSPLLTQLSDIPPRTFCPEAGCAAEFCECTHLVKVPLGAVVEIIIADTASPSLAAITHPFHIHGHDFFILEQGTFRPPFARSLAELKARLAQDRVISDFLPTKDTVTIPASGYAVVRVLADNPGFWLYHCHFAYHLSVGMSAIIQVGELTDMPSSPANIPRCSQFLGSRKSHAELLSKRERAYFGLA